MTLRIDGLADLDPSTVPLPIGTDVMTLVDRDGRTQGAYGRVSKLDGERVDVTFLDDTRAVPAGTRIRAEVDCDPSETGTCEVHWSVALDGGPVEHHDTRRGRRSRRDQF